MIGELPLDPTTDQDLLPKNSVKGNIKFKINQAMRGQILAYNPTNNTLSREGISSELLPDGTENPDNIDIRSLLEWHHVYGAMQDLIASRTNLRERVGVLPPYNEERMQEFALNAAVEMVWEKLGLDDAALSKGSPQERERIIQARNDEAKKHISMAKELLAANKLADNFFSIYLETMFDNGYFLGNPHTPNLPFKKCEQVVIPFNNGYHYTVAVVHFYEVNKDLDEAFIKYYDSLGADLDMDLQTQLSNYFTNLGFSPKYKCVSYHDQTDGHNCSIFACGKAIDIVNENFKYPERLLGDLTQGNYEQTMAYYRRIFTERLKKSGQNVKPSPNLSEAFEKNQEKFKELSSLSQEISSFNGFLIGLISEFETALASIVKIDVTKMPVIPSDKLLPNIDPMLYLERLMWFRYIADGVLQEKNKLEHKTQKDRDDIECLKNLLISFHGLSTYVIDEAEKLHKSMSQEVPNKPYVSFLSDYSWKTLSIIAGLSTVGLFVGVPFLLAGILNLGAMLPNSPFLLMIFGGGIFFAGSQFVPWIYNYLNPEEQQQEEPIQPQQNPEPNVNNTSTQNENAPLLNQFNLNRNENNNENRNNAERNNADTPGYRNFGYDI